MKVTGVLQNEPEEKTFGESSKMDLKVNDKFFSYWEPQVFPHKGDHVAFDVVEKPSKDGKKIFKNVLNVEIKTVSNSSMSKPSTPSASTYNEPIKYDMIMSYAKDLVKEMIASGIIKTVEGAIEAYKKIYKAQKEMLGQSDTQTDLESTTTLEPF